MVFWGFGGGFVCKNMHWIASAPKFKNYCWIWKKRVLLKLTIPGCIVLGCNKNSYFHCPYYVQFSAILHSSMQTKAPKPLRCALPPLGGASILWAVGNLFPEPTRSPSFCVGQTQIHPRFHVLLFEGGKLLWSLVPFLMELAEIVNSLVNCLWGVLAGNETGSNPLGNWIPAEHSWLWAQLAIEGARQICVCVSSIIVLLCLEPKRGDESTSN